MTSITTFLLISIILAFDVLALRLRIIKTENKIESLISLMEKQNEINKKFNEIYTELDKNGK